MNCGGEKFGALTSCQKCAFIPRDVIDRAKSVVLSDHHFQGDELDQFAEQIRLGITPDLPSEAVDGYIQLFEKESLEKPSPSKDRWSFLSVVASVVVPIAAILAFGFVMVLGFRLAEMVFGAPERGRPRPLASGRIVHITDTRGNSLKYESREATIYSEYVQVRESGSSLWLPREQLGEIRLSD
jgi:hypothetical protein